MGILISLHRITNRFFNVFFFYMPVSFFPPAVFGFVYLIISLVCRHVCTYACMVTHSVPLVAGVQHRGLTTLYVTRISHKWSYHLSPCDTITIPPTVALHPNFMN